MENFKFQEGFDFTVGSRLKTNTHSVPDSNRDCPDCIFLKQSLADCKKLLSSTEKKHKLLIAQKSELQKDLKKLENSYSALKKDSENCTVNEIIHKKDLEIQRLREELAKTQSLFQDLTQEYDSFTINMSKIGMGDEEDVEEILREKDLIIGGKDEALTKAQGIIKKLNEECERMGNQLIQSQDQNSDLSLSAELKIIKKKYKDLKSKQFEESEHQSFIISTLQQEKQDLEQTLEDLNQKFIEIESMTSSRLTTLYDYLTKIQDLESDLQRKSSTIESNKKKILDLELSKQLEIESLKKSAQLAFTALPAKDSPPVPTQDLLEFKLKNLKSIIKQLLLSDIHLQKHLRSLIESESELIKSSIFQVDSKAEEFRADFERWVMRNEELEQRLVSVENNNLKLIRIVGDLQKIILAKDRQFDEVIKVYTGIGREMQGTIEFLSVELSDKQAFIVKDLLPKVFDCVHRVLAETQVEVFKNFKRVKYN